MCRWGAMDLRNALFQVLGSCVTTGGTAVDWCAIDVIDIRNPRLTSPSLHPRLKFTPGQPCNFTRRHTATLATPVSLGVIVNLNIAWRWLHRTEKRTRPLATPGPEPISRIYCQRLPPTRPILPNK